MYFFGTNIILFSRGITESQMGKKVNRKLTPTPNQLLGHTLLKRIALISRSVKPLFPSLCPRIAAF